MSMIKVIPPGSYDFGERAAELIKFSSYGLTGDDLNTFIKRASPDIANDISKLSFSKGEIPIHLIALGATEFGSINRNGDGFKVAMCRKFHNTFVKHAHFYRSHQNKDAAKSYGVVKYSAFNEPMGRIELVVGLNGTKEAARRNGGLIADKEIDLLEKQAEIPVSMAIRVPSDFCSSCENEAKTRVEYCTEDMCKHGGLKHNITKVCEDGHILHADNRSGAFFDISHVFRPADRIAYVLGQLEKAASNHIMGGAELAEFMDVSAPADLIVSNIADRTIKSQVKLALTLSNIEKQIASNMSSVKYASSQFTNIPILGLDKMGREAFTKERAEIFKALANEKIALSLVDFIQLISGKESDKAQELCTKVAHALPGVFTRLVDNVDTLVDALKSNPFKFAGHEPSTKLKVWASKLAADYSLDTQHSERRLWRAVINSKSASSQFRAPLTKLAESYEGLARAYGLYKLSFLSEVEPTDNDFALTSRSIVEQNYIN